MGRLAESINPTVIVLSLPHPNKRHQVSRAIRNVKTSITIIADDDVIWPPHLLPHILAPFEDRSVGAVGTCQRVRRNKDLSLYGRVWEFLGASYIQRRNFEITATSNIDRRTRQEVPWVVDFPIGDGPCLLDCSYPRPRDKFPAKALYL